MRQRPMAGVLAGVMATAGVVIMPSSSSQSADAVAVPASTLAAGALHTLVVKADGTLWSFGADMFGQLGAVSPGPNPLYAAPMQVMAGVARVAAGGQHSLVVKTDGTLWTFGSDFAGALGPRPTGTGTSPNPIPTQVMAGVAQAAGGSSHSLVLATDGTLWGFGSNDVGQLGTAAPDGSAVPSAVMNDVALMAAGAKHSLVVRTDGTLWTFGWNAKGQLGSGIHNGTDLGNPVPTQLMTDVAEVAAGWSHSLALKNDGTLWSFGSNRYGELGTTTNSGTDAANPVPTKVMTEVAQIAAGGSHSLALKTDGTLWSFGANDVGQLGTTTNSGTDAPNPLPTEVMTEVAEIAAGGAHTVVVRADGTLWTFGGNFYGQLGTEVNVWTNLPNPVPTRIMSGLAVPALVGGRLPAGAVKEVKVTGVGGVPARGVAAVALNVTVTQPAAAGHVTVYPCGARPATSNVNFTAAQTVANAVITAVSATGTVCFAASASTHLVADVGGWYPAGPAGFQPLGPARAFDTRDGTGGVAATRVASDGTLAVPFGGRTGVPATGVAAVALNVTATEPEAAGYVTVHACGARPATSNLNYVAGQTVANAVTAAVAADGSVCFSASAPMHLVVDIEGWYPTNPSGFQPLTPARVFDTRDGTGGVAPTRISSGGTLAVAVAGAHGVPASGVSAVSLNVTVTGPTGSGHLTVHPCGARPGTSNVNYVAGQTVPNAVIAPVSPDGKVCFYALGETHLLADVNGWFPATPAGFQALTPFRLFDTRN